ncbi:glycosyltransferase [Paraconexibacter antarcticus]|uniref:Glycosyltransferase n=1 Tax=Paraconexibacter antarcticus TaxID=2949664 RepID=A0ABY5DWB4_9ACTN|nr:glycosyltransferase [Paraconexibacter antarcticus]UTI65951.1 glycosyltransferase [Paraconexibacter antarcticus]
MTLPQRKTSRADLHCHSTASVLSKLGVQRSLGLPECATPPEDVLELATRRGMDFVTITDHDTIVGAQQIEDDPRVFLSEELTAWFKGEPQAVHVLCYGITPDDHDWLQAHNRDVEACAEYLREHEITSALAHPFYAVEAPLTPRHRRRLAQLFPVWETRNGSRARELNQPSAVYIETHGGIGIGGSDDHAGVDIGRTFTETPRAATWQEFLANIRAGRASARGEQGSAEKWAHAAMGLATRALGTPPAGLTPKPNPAAVLTMVERVMREGDVRGGAIGADLGPEDARAILRAWLDSIDLDLTEPELLAYLQAEDFQHSGLFRRARRKHERKFAATVHEIAALAEQPIAGADYLGAAGKLFDACIAAIPYAPAAAFLGKEKGKLVSRDGEPLRVALVADGVGGMHGVTHTLDEIRERGVPGFEVEVVGTDANVDRRLSAVAEIDIPYYAGLKVGVPSLPQVVETLAEGRYDVVHLCSPGPAGAAAAIIARIMDLPILGSYHTELAAYAGLRSADPQLEVMARMAVAAFYGQCRQVLTPSPQSDEVLRQMGIPEERIGRWDRGVDIARFDPAKRDPEVFAALDAPADRVNVLYVGRQTKEKGADLLADAFLTARTRDERLHLVLAGGGPEEQQLRARLGEHATFLGWQEGEELAVTFASADAFLFASRTDTFGQVLLEAQASGLPVIAVNEGGPCSIIEHGVTGLLADADRHALADALIDVASSPLLRERLTRAGLAAVRERTWERALGRLADGYHRTLGPAAHTAGRRVA